ncbi:MAG: 2OG-Fe(II) oxygenase [Nannocystaceae bacterium]
MLERHDFVPDFILPTASGVPTRFFGVAPGTLSLLALTPPGVPIDPPPPGIQLFVIHNRPPASDTSDTSDTSDNSKRANMAHRTTFIDSEARIWNLCAGRQRARALLLSENLRVLDIFGPDSSRWSAAIRRSIKERPPTQALPHAPILLIPNALDAVFCDRLVDTWASSGHAESGVEISSDGGRSHKLISALKRRQDHVVTDQQLLQQLTERVARRVKPELSKAFAFDATRFEGFKIGRYQASDHGYFRRHRDNLSPATLHRRFALSLNLNDAYDGGELVFPEYSARYRPAKGGAIVFSCSLLHEAAAVTRGQRYVLVSFMYRAQDGRAKTPPGS